jgi:hypothetical protein
MTSHAASSPPQAYPSRRELRNRAAAEPLLPEPGPAPDQERTPTTPADPIVSTARRAHVADPLPRNRVGEVTPVPVSVTSPDTGEVLSVLRAVSPASLDAIDLASVTALSREDLRLSLDTLLSNQFITASHRQPRTPDHPVQILYHAR